MSALAGDNRLPRYQRLADALRARIVDRSWKPGDRIPSENVIAEQFGVAPGTARQALAALVDEGLLERQHGRGTFVRRPSFDQSLFRFFRFSGAAGERLIPESRILRRSVDVMPSEVARQLGVSEGSEGIAMDRLRLIDGAPILAEQIWLPLPRFQPFLAIDPADIGPLLYPIYDASCEQTVARAEESLTAEAADATLARLLRVARGTPLIVIDRLARDYAGDALEWRRSRGPAERFRYRTEIR
ncbi:MAG: GntR family transcriptional regulator [Rhodocyclaceae bacterium]|nr:GntR family transcriptional regulator [Rhodocyclaceae bacterium]